MVDQTVLCNKQLYIKYDDDDGPHAALYPADRLEWDYEKGFLRVFNGETLMGIYDLGIVRFAHVRDKSQK